MSSSADKSETRDGSTELPHVHFEIQESASGELRSAQFDDFHHYGDFSSTHQHDGAIAHYW